MGASQSRSSEPEIHQQLLTRLRALELEHRQREAQVSADIQKGYVFVNDRQTASDAQLPAYEEPRRDVSTDVVLRWQKELLNDPKNRLALSAFTKNPAAAIVSSRATAIADQQHFNIKIPLEGSPVTNQRSSGRCWLFASTNVFRIAIMKKYDLKEFELSQAYLFFYDKLEKANYFLNTILNTLDEPLDGRLLQALLSAPVNDGGQWDMVANLVEKYGLLPQSLYPDSFNAMNSSSMDELITTKLREDAIRLRSMAKGSSQGSSLGAAKTLMMKEIHLILTLMLGPPPSPDKEFRWEFNDSQGNYHSVETTPMEFAKQLSDRSVVRALGGTDVHKLFSLVHDPRNEFETLLTVDKLGNIVEGRPITYVNVKMSQLKAAAIATLKKGIPVFFGSDVGQYSDSKTGIMDTELYDYELGFNVRLGLSKAERLMVGESQMTHAMVLTGVHIENGKDVRWRVENSWSETAGDKGYFVMSGDWFDEFVYQAVVSPDVVEQSVIDVLKQKPKVLPNWDPMGALA